MHANPARGHVNKRGWTDLGSSVDKQTLCKIYDATRAQSDPTIVRAGTDTQGGYYLYMPKREHWLAATTYKAPSIRQHRQVMVDLLTTSSEALRQEPWVSKEDRLALIQLKRLSMKDIAREDFTAGELKSKLKPLNNSVRARERLVNRANLNAKFSPIPKGHKDYYKQFLRKTSADTAILRAALFGGRGRSLSFSEELAIIKSVNTLLNNYLHQGSTKQPLARMIQQSPQKDLLMRFASAWLDHVQRSDKLKNANLLQTFSWQKAITDVAKLIQQQTSAHVVPKSRIPVSPERAAGIQRMLERTAAHADVDSPYKTRSAAPSAAPSELALKHKQMAPAIIVGNTVPSEIEVVSLTDSESSSAVEFSDERRMLKESEGAYTIYADVPVAAVTEARSGRPLEQ
jgi:hypothetical protein